MDDRTKATAQAEEPTAAYEAPQAQDLETLDSPSVTAAGFTAVGQ